MFEITKNDPIPSEPTLPSKFPFKAMEVGDSFSVTDPNLQKKAVSSAHTYGWVNNKKFKTRTVGGITKIWRVA